MNCFGGRWKIIIILCVSFLVASGCVTQSPTKNVTATLSDINHLNILVENKSVTTFIAYDETSKANLSSFNIQKPEELQIPASINKFDVVTFNHALLNEHLKSGEGIKISIGGKVYQTKISRMSFENIDDGIDSYHGTLLGVNYSEIMVTTSAKTLTGNINTEDGIFWIIPVEPGIRIESSQSPLHIIYNSKNVKNTQFRID